MTEKAKKQAISRSLFVTEDVKYGEKITNKTLEVFVLVCRILFL